MSTSWLVLPDEGNEAHVLHHCSRGNGDKIARVRIGKGGRTTLMLGPHAAQPGGRCQVGTDVHFVAGAAG